MRPPTQTPDPVGWCRTISLLFAALCLLRIGVPSSPYFDEIHYLPAARGLLDGSQWLNREHPPLGKEIIAAGIALLGDRALGWRIFSALAGGVALYAWCRALWYTSGTRFAPVAGGILLATAFPLFVHARIAMLDVFMVAFLMIGFWQCVGAVREPETGRGRLAIAGVALGLAMAAKWNAVPLAMAPGIAFLVLRLIAGRRRLLRSRRGMPVPGITLIEASVWLGAVPLIVYTLTYIPLIFIAENPLDPGAFLQLHRSMVVLQENVVQPHPYQSNWSDWVLNIRAIWYLYEPVDGAQRGVLLIGNPLTVLLGLPALLWCAWQGIFRGRNDAMAVLVLYLASLGFWIVVNKPVQFYYHYFLPSCFLIAALALALDAFWQRGRRWLPVAVLTGSVALFGYFYPILSAAPLAGPDAFLTWTWLDSWR